MRNGEHQYRYFNLLAAICINRLTMPILSSLCPFVAGHQPGTGCYREVAAYLLDAGSVCGVPETTLAEARHRNFSFGGRGETCAAGGGGKGIHSLVERESRIIPTKVGSLQAFVEAEATMDDLSPSVLPTFEVQKVAVLDMRLMNADRNAANLLARRRRTSDGVAWTLTPIDHGYILRTKADVAWCDWVWLEWPQLKEPITKKLKQYVLSINIDKVSRKAIIYKQTPF